MDAPIVRRPVDPAIQPVEEGQIGIQPGPVGSGVSRAHGEGVLGVVEVTELEVPVDGVELLVLQDEVLDLRPAHALQPDRVSAGRHGLADDGHQRASVGVERRGDVQFEDDAQDVRAVHGVDAVRPERQPLQLVGRPARQQGRGRTDPAAARRRPARRASRWVSPRPPGTGSPLHSAWCMCRPALRRRRPGTERRR